MAEHGTRVGATLTPERTGLLQLLLPLLLCLCSCVCSSFGNCSSNIFLFTNCFCSRSSYSSLLTAPTSSAPACSSYTFLLLLLLSLLCFLRLLTQSFLQLPLASLFPPAAAPAAVAPLPGQVWQSAQLKLIKKFWCAQRLSLQIAGAILKCAAQAARFVRPTAAAAAATTSHLKATLTKCQNVKKRDFTLLAKG